MLLARGCDTRQQQAAEAHTAHERAEQHSHGHGGGPDDELEQLKPDDFVDERGTTAADKQQEQAGQEPARGHQVTFDEVHRSRFRVQTAVSLYQLSWLPPSGRKS